MNPSVCKTCKSQPSWTHHGLRLEDLLEQFTTHIHHPPHTHKDWEK